MRFRNNYIIKVLSIGLLTLITWSIILFAARQLTQRLLWISVIPKIQGNLHIQPSGLLPDLDNEPNKVRLSQVNAYIGEDALLAAFTINDIKPPPQWQYCYNIRRVEKIVKNVFGGDKQITKFVGIIYFDNKRGLFAYIDFSNDIQSDQGDKYSVIYAGPKGISDMPDKNLGQFKNPVSAAEGLAAVLVVYDKSLSCFFRIDFDEKLLTNGPKIPTHINYVQIASFRKNRNAICIDWQPPMIKKTVDKNVFQPNDVTKTKVAKKVIIAPVDEDLDDSDIYWGDFVPVLNENGQIEKLDLKTLELTGRLGHLPTINFGFNSPQTDTLLAYKVHYVLRNGKYNGLVAASLSRDATKASIIVYDKNGELIKIEDENSINLSRYRSVSRYKYACSNILSESLSLSLGPFCMFINYLIENLNPPLLSAASYFTASSFEATAGHRGLFLLPNSYAGEIGRDVGEFPFAQFLRLLLLISPSLLLGGLLARRVAGDAREVGLSRQVRKFWIIGTIAFGLPAYITYRLTRPRIRQVTCVNCGKLRRPDMELCHHCRSRWQVPELTPPDWRVMD